MFPQPPVISALQRRRSHAPGRKAESRQFNDL